MRNVSMFLRTLCRACADWRRSARASSQRGANLKPELAEKLLIHKADFVCSTLGRYTRIEAIVIVAIGIDKNGDVLHPTVVSGPQIVRKAVLDAVRKYKYKPYLLNGNAVEVETTVSVDTGCDHFCFSD